MPREPRRSGGRHTTRDERGRTAKEPDRPHNPHRPKAGGPSPTEPETPRYGHPGSTTAMSTTTAHHHQLSGHLPGGTSGSGETEHHTEHTTNTGSGGDDGSDGRPHTGHDSGETGPDCGGDELLRQMYEHDRTVLFSYVLRLTRGDAQHAEDIVQETMLRAWQNARKLGTRRAQLRPWLATVARNVFIDSHRRLQSRPQETEADAIEFVPVADESDNLLAQIAITGAMTSLSKAHREVLVELYYRGRTLQDAARILDIPVGTVKSRAYHALRALRVILEERGVTPGF
ncbi:MAG: putative sigma factor [Actinomycetia bacterium]|nr:putative sigma factor [Actinomycetes bacterium]MDQ1659230.1 polymerase sigma-70 factor, subfamily [Cryptosporangiaceae bacterium]